MAPKLYEITWTETTTCVAYVRADDDDEARKHWRENELVSRVNRWTDGSILHAVTEMPSFHDKLCCCPNCEGGL